MRLEAWLSSNIRAGWVERARCGRGGDETEFEVRGLGRCRWAAARDSVVQEVAKRLGGYGAMILEEGGGAEATTWTISTAWRDVETWSQARRFDLMRRAISLTILALGVAPLLVAADRVEGSELLASYEFWTNGGGSPEPEPRVELILQLPTDFPPTDFFGLGEDADLFWEDGEQGSYDFMADNDPAFNAFAAHATNGVPEQFMLWTHFPTGGGGGNVGTESELFGALPDLTGRSLEVVRLIVEDVSITPWNPDPDENPAFAGFKYSVRGRYEFYGDPVPEPASLLLLAIGAIRIIRPRGRR